MQVPTMLRTPVLARGHHFLQSHQRFAAGAGLTASYAGSGESEIVTSGVSIFLANATGGLPGSGADGTVPFKVRGCMSTDSGCTSRHVLFPAAPKHHALSHMETALHGWKLASTVFKHRMLHQRAQKLCQGPSPSKSGPSLQVMAASFGPSIGALASAGAQKLAIAGANPALACGPLSARLHGAVALVLRGNCTFSTKVGALFPAPLSPNVFRDLPACRACSPRSLF